MKLKYFNPFYYVFFGFFCILGALFFLAENAADDAGKIFMGHK